MRENAFIERGGDTVVMERLHEWLNRFGHTAVIDIESKEDPRRFDLVHLFNFATPKATEPLARACVEAKTPFVVTTMYEDWPMFFNQMVIKDMILRTYVKYDQTPEAWEKLSEFTKRVFPSHIQDNTYTAHYASALIPTGYHEAVSLRRDYPHTNLIEIYHCGTEVSPCSDGGEAFRKTYGVEDFILCVGRLEKRKNQLSLLKALEDSPLTVVFAMGGFTFETEYEAGCRAFKRKGRTMFVGKIPPELLASAYEAARVHVLPSWYELPGLVSIEAAARGTNIVVSDYGTIRDYVGDDAFYASPADIDDIARVVERAWQAPKNPALSERVKKFTWENATRRNIEIYEMALASNYKADDELYEIMMRTQNPGPEELTSMDEYPLLKETLGHGSRNAAQSKQS